MSLEKILEKIHQDARVEVEKIVSEAKMKAIKIKEEAEKEAKQASDVLIREAERQANLEARRILTQARLERKIQILDSKRRLIEEVLEKAFESEDLQKKILKRKVILKDGEEEIPLDKKRLKEEMRLKLEKYIAEVLNL